MVGDPRVQADIESDQLVKVRELLCLILDELRKIRTAHEMGHGEDIEVLYEEEVP
jgi:hypothetical protein